MGHSWSDPRSRDSAPERRAATLPSPTARRIWRCSHLQLSYNPEGLQRESSSLLLNPKLPVDLRKALPPQRATEDGLFPMTTYFEDYVLREDVLGNVKHFSTQFS